MKNVKEIVSRNIQARRKRLGYTQELLAQECGVSHPSIQKIEAGKSLPRAQTLEKLASVLEFEVYQLFMPDPGAKDPSPTISELAREIVKRDEEIAQLKSGEEPSLTKLRRLSKNQLSLSLHIPEDLSAQRETLLATVSTFEKALIQSLAVDEELDSLLDESSAESTPVS